MTSSVVTRCIDRISRIPADEIARQYRLLSKGADFRATITLVTYALAALFIPLPAALACAAADYGFERAGQRWMKDLVPADTPWRYVGTLVSMVLSQVGFTTMLALSYQSDAPLAQPFAAGVLTLTMLQMASVRVIHLPYAGAGLTTAFGIACIAVIYDWQSRSGALGLILSLLALLAAAYFVAAIVLDNHTLHRDIARERATSRMADQAKSRFLAQMSHELRTPLNAILGLGHAELAQARNAGSQERLRLVTDAARGLAVILDDILDMSAIEAGHLPIRPVLCDPTQEITAAGALYRPLFHAQGLDLSIFVTPDLPTRTVMDKQRLRQCLSNLFSNALKHTTTGGVSLSAGLDSDGRLAIRFADTGPGIAPDDAERIFQPFQRGAGAQPGSGLGLSITRALARSMGGDLRLLTTDDPNGGSGARFLLTLALQPPDDSDPVATLANAAAPGRSSGLRVLVVDDIPTNRLVAKAHLRLFGVETEEAASGVEAVTKLRQAPVDAPFDLVLLDMNMPELSGIATLRQIRTLPSRAARVPVIAMTADATDAHRRKYLDAGLDGYLAKPLTPEAVADLLADVLGPTVAPRTPPEA